jgi:hypothetical protein
MIKHVPLVLRMRGKYRFPGEACAVHRTSGEIIADVDTATASELIANGIADLFVGDIPSDATFLNPQHPQSDYQRSLKRRQEQETMIRSILNQHT